MKLKNWLLQTLAIATALFATSCQKEEGAITENMLKINDIMECEVGGFSDSNLTVDVSLYEGVEVDSYVIGIIPAEDFSNKTFTSDIIAAIEDRGASASIVDNEYIFDSSAKVNLAELWDIEAERDYVVGVFAINSLGEATSEAFSKKFSILGEPFKIDVVEVGDVNCTIKVKVEQTTIKNYFVAAAPTDKLTASFGDDYYAMAESVIEVVKDNYSNDFSSANNVFTFDSSATIEVHKAWKLTPNTNYLILVFGIESNGDINGSVMKVEVKTIPTPQSDNQISLYASDITSTGAVISTTTTNNDPYYFDVVPTETFAAYDDSAIIDIIFAQAEGQLPQLLSNGNDSYDLTGYLTPNTSYTPIAFSTNGTTANSGLFKGEAFTTTDSSSDPEVVIPETIIIPDVEFGEVAISPASSTSLMLDVTPNDEKMSYISFILETDYFEGFDSMESLIYADLQYMQSESEYYGSSIVKDWNIWTSTGTFSDEVPELEPGVNYTAYVYGLDRTTLQPLTKVATAVCTTSSNSPAANAPINLASLMGATKNQYPPLVLRTKATQRISKRLR